MSKEGKLTVVPRLRFPEFRGAEGWASQKLIELTEVVRGGSPRPIDAYITTEPDGLNWLKIGDVPKDSKYITSTEQKVLKTALSKTREIAPGDFILSNSMSFGRPYLSKIRTCIHDGWIAVTSLPDSVSRNFLYYSMMSEASQTYFESQAAGGGVRNLTVDIVKLLPVGVPRPAEQERIANCLTALDEVIAAQGRKVEALKTHRRGLMQQLFPREGETLPRWRFPEFRAGLEWEPKKLEDLVEIQSGSTPSKAIPAFWNGVIPWVSAKDMKRLFLDDAEDHISTNAVDDGAKLVPQGTLLILTRGMTLLKDVPICVLRREMSFNQDVKALLPKGETSGLFVALMLLGNKNRLLGMVDIAGHGTGKLNTYELKVLVLASPKPAEQQRIAAFLSSLDTQIAAEADKLAMFKTHKRGLMQQLFPSAEAV